MNAIAPHTSTETSPQTSPRTATAAPHRSRAARILLTLLGTLALVLGSAAASQAYQVNTRQNVPTTPTLYRVYGSHQNIGTPASAQWVRQLRQSGPVVRHTMTGDQNVQLTYTVYRYVNGAWSADQVLRYGRNFAAGSASLQMPSLFYTSTSAGYFVVRVNLTWNTLGGARQSTFVATMNGAGDSVCNTVYQCSAPSWIYLS